MRKKAASIAAAALLAVLALAAPAAAVNCGANLTTCTPVSFSISGGTIALQAPTVTATGTPIASGTGAYVDIAIGNTLVTPSLTSPGWTVDATASDFAPASGPALSKLNAEFSVPNLPTASLCPSNLIARKSNATAVDGSGTTTAIISCSSGGTTTTTFNPTLRVNIPGGTAAGTYTGTVTQSAY